MNIVMRQAIGLREYKQGHETNCRYVCEYTRLREKLQIYVRINKVMRQATYLCENEQGHETSYIFM